MSGILTGRSDAPPSRILDAMLRGSFPFLLSMELLAEYRAILLRPKIRRRHRLSENEIDLVLTELAANARFEDVGTVREGARGDEHLEALLETFPGSVLVTGDRPLARSCTGLSVLTPREFLNRIEA